MDSILWSIYILLMLLADLKLSYSIVLLAFNVMVQQVLFGCFLCETQPKAILCSQPFVQLQLLLPDTNLHIFLRSPAAKAVHPNDQSSKFKGFNSPRNTLALPLKYTSINFHFRGYFPQVQGHNELANKASEVPVQFPFIQ